MRYRAKLYGSALRPNGDVVATILWWSVEAIQKFGWWHQEAVIGHVRDERFTGEDAERVLPKEY